VTAEDGWRLLAAALAERRATPPLVPEKPWGGLPTPLAGAETLPESLRLAVAVIDDRPLDALTERPGGAEALTWYAVALRRAGRFQEARRAFRELGVRPTDTALLDRALPVLCGAGAGYRWASEAASHLAERGSWDPVWFVDACAAACAGLLSRETGALLEEVQRAELLLLIAAGSAGQP
jgi:hypothetical protein